MKHLVVIFLFTFSILPMLNIPINEADDVTREIIETESIRITKTELFDLSINNRNAKINVVIPMLISDLVMIQVESLAQFSEQIEIRKYLGS